MRRRGRQAAPKANWGSRSEPSALLRRDGRSASKMRSTKRSNVLVEVEHRFERGAHLRRSARDQRDPVDRRKDDRADGEDRQQQEEDDAQRRRPKRDGTPRRSNHSSIGTSAMAMTSAAVTGMKNSAPARSANGRATIRPMPAISVSEASKRSRLIVMPSANARTSSPRPASCLLVRASMAAPYRACSPAASARNALSCWCPWSDSNGHSLQNSILSRARLPFRHRGPPCDGRA